MVSWISSINSRTETFSVASRVDSCPDFWVKRNWWIRWRVTTWCSLNYCQWLDFFENARIGTRNLPPICFFNFNNPSSPFRRRGRSRGLQCLLYDQLLGTFDQGAKRSRSHQDDGMNSDAVCVLVVFSFFLFILFFGGEGGWNHRVLFVPNTSKNKKSQFRTVGDEIFMLVVLFFHLEIFWVHLT